MFHLEILSPCCCYCYITSVVSDSVRPHRRQPTRLPRPWDSPGKNTGVGGHFLLQCMKVKSESQVAQSYLTLSDPMDCSLPGFSVHRIFQQKYWSGVPLPSPKLVLFLCECWLHFLVLGFLINLLGAESGRYFGLISFFFLSILPSFSEGSFSLTSSSL